MPGESWRVLTFHQITVQTGRAASLRKHVFLDGAGRWYQVGVQGNDG